MKKSVFLVILLLSTCILFTACTESDRMDTSYTPELYVQSIPTLPDSFIQGVDISSLIALEESGVSFKTKTGEPADLFHLLSDAEYNAVRVRIWNNPYNSTGDGFGGGNNDLEKAVALGKRATAENMRLFVDFHYSDFWADPAKQQAPLEWATYSLEEKSEALYQFTYESLSKMLDEKIDISIVQIGNETTNGLAGETNWKSIATLLSAGSDAVKKINSEYKKDIQVAIHFTNPEKADSYTRYADILKNFDVSYDIFASSYYPYWHGSLENLTDVLSKIATDYDKKILIAETSYGYTLENGDAHPNTVSSESSFELKYPVSVQGQSYFLQDLTRAVHTLGDAGLGVFYWEPAWIGLPERTIEEQQAKWETYGSGWAASFAKDYDPEDAGLWYGGSSWDNQALFDFSGAPLDSLYTFKYIREGLSTERKVESVMPVTLRIRTDESIILPEQVSVYYNDNTTENAVVTWENHTVTTEEIGVFSITGTVEGCMIPAVANIQVVLPNYVENESFETGDATSYTIENIGNVTTELGVIEKATDSKTGTHAFHFYSTDAVAFKLEQHIEHLTEGTYNFSLALQGGDADDAEMYLYAITSTETYQLDTSVNGWNNWRVPVLENIPISDGKVTIGIFVKSAPKAWGTIDDFALTK